jgi:hypothetical protein
MAPTSVDDLEVSMHQPWTVDDVLIRELEEMLADEELQAGLRAGAEREEIELGKGNRDKNGIR